MIEKLKKIDHKFYLVGLLLIALGLWLYILWPGEQALYIHVLDIGQGDAIFIETSSGKQVLVDGGQGESVLEQLGEVMGSMDRTIDMVVLTHAHADHVGGLVPVLERYEVASVLEYRVNNYETSIYTQWQNALEEEGAQYWNAELDMRIDLGDGIWMKVYVTEKEESNQNDNSVVLSIWQNDSCVALLTGDIEAKEEGELLATGFDVNCQVLKAPHHGSKSSSSQEFLDAVGHEVVVISSGKDNQFGHPHEETLSKYTDYDVYRTDEDGRVEMKFAGGELVDIGY